MDVPCNVLILFRLVVLRTYLISLRGGAVAYLSNFLEYLPVRLELIYICSYEANELC